MRLQTYPSLGCVRKAQADRKPIAIVFDSKPACDAWVTYIREEGDQTVALLKVTQTGKKDSPATLSFPEYGKGEPTFAFA